MRVLDNVEDGWLTNPEVPANDGVVPAAGDEGAPWRHGQALHAPLVLRHFGRPNSAQLLSRYVWLHGKDTLVDIKFGRYISQLNSAFCILGLMLKSVFYSTHHHIAGFKSVL